MPLQDRGRLLEFRKQSGCVGSVLLRILLECSDLRWLEREAPVQVDPPKACGLFEKRQTVIGENLSCGVRVFPLAWKVEPRHHARVLIQARAFRHSTQCALDRAQPRVEFLVR